MPLTQPLEEDHSSIISSQMRRKLSFALLVLAGVACLWLLYMLSNSM